MISTEFWWIVKIYCHCRLLQSKQLFAFIVQYFCYIASMCICNFLSPFASCRPREFENKIGPFLGQAYKVTIAADQSGYSFSCYCWFIIPCCFCCIRLSQFPSACLPGTVWHTQTKGRKTVVLVVVVVAAAAVVVCQEECFRNDLFCIKRDVKLLSFLYTTFSCCIWILLISHILCGHY